MASAPQAQLPLFYKDLMPLNSRDHKDWKSKNFDDASFIGSTHAIPLTIDEFVDAQRQLPIVFTDRVQGVSKMSKNIVYEAAFMVWRLRFLSLLGRLE